MIYDIRATQKKSSPDQAKKGEGKKYSYDTYSACTLPNIFHFVVKKRLVVLPMEQPTVHISSKFRRLLFLSFIKKKRSRNQQVNHLKVIFIFLGALQDKSTGCFRKMQDLLTKKICHFIEFAIFCSAFIFWPFNCSLLLIIHTFTKLLDKHVIRG